MESFITNAIYCRFWTQCVGRRIQNSWPSIRIGIMGHRWWQFHDSPYSRGLQRCISRVPCSNLRDREVFCTYPWNPNVCSYSERANPRPYIRTNPSCLGRWYCANSRRKRWLWKKQFISISKHTWSLGWRWWWCSEIRSGFTLVLSVTPLIPMFRSVCPCYVEIIIVQLNSCMGLGCWMPSYWSMLYIGSRDVLLNFFSVCTISFDALYF